MNFFSGIYDAVKRKHAEMKDRKDFLDMVENKAKPIRRAAYMKQMLKEVVNEGIQKAKADVDAKNPKKLKTEKDFGIGEEMMNSLNDPYKFLNPKKKKKSKLKEKKK